MAGSRFLSRLAVRTGPRRWAPLGSDGSPPVGLAVPGDAVAVGDRQQLFEVPSAAAGQAVEAPLVLGAAVRSSGMPGPGWVLVAAAVAQGAHCGLAHLGAVDGGKALGRG